ncbi:DUF2784 domain-containing protein [Massilia glaciei]|uniref:DUF2784 domain-containing protein n=1 Tax=Massilia glaciei TaxID=1524097 RepID=A0A2U2I5H8_9BURK|nr:DUF2784 domain-containing protein [Massilia glaciei]PWF54895.1 DUF2784 domain-containing protein [Massilia glaciei]
MAQESSWYPLLADGVLMLHAGVVLFVVPGLPLILVGGARRWAWVRNLPLRLLHLATIGYVALQSWFGIMCPLTTLEHCLRERGGQIVAEGDFIAHWLGKLLFFTAPPWVFVLVALVALSWVLVPPRRRRAHAGAPPRHA